MYLRRPSLGNAIASMTPNRHQTSTYRMLRRGMRASLLGTSWVVLTLLSACADAQEAKRVELPLFTDGAGLEPITTDLDYRVELTSATLAVDDLKFAVAGDAHASLLRKVSNALVPVAHAHPGHFQSGEVTGELPGHFALRFVPGKPRLVGTATLLVGTYRSVNFTLSYASEGDVAADDPALGHTAVLSGTATREGRRIDFQVRIDSPVGRELVGIPFEQQVTEAAEPLTLRLVTRDPLENDTLLDGVDFALLDGDGDNQVLIEQSSPDAPSADACNTVRRILQTHDHFLVRSEG